MKHFPKILMSLCMGASFAQADLVRIPGKVTGFPPLRRDDTVDAALVVPSLRPLDVLQFQFDSLLSPSETMKVGPLTVDVPGNFYIPDQTENWGFLPISLKKETFTFTSPRGLDQEISTLYAQAPFSKMIDLMQNHAPFTEVLKLVVLKGFGFENNQNLNSINSLTTKIDRTFSKTLSYKWTRGALPQNSSDMIVNFQRSPKNRWVIADLIGSAAASGILGSAEGFDRVYKTLFLRATNSAKGDLVSAVGQIRASTDTNGFIVNSVPEQISGAQIQSSQRVVWNSISQAGWIAILRSSDSKTSVETWVDAATGSFDLNPALDSKERLTLIFIGTDRPVPSPTADGQSDEPELFTFASELRMLKLQ